MNGHRFPTKTSCLHCGYEFNRTSEVNHPAAAPGAGDYSICIACGAIAVFADDLTLRPPTVEEIAIALADKVIISVRLALQEKSVRTDWPHGPGVTR